MNNLAPRKNRKTYRKNRTRRLPCTRTAAGKERSQNPAPPPHPNRWLCEVKGISQERDNLSNDRKAILHLDFAMFRSKKRYVRRVKKIRGGACAGIGIRIKDCMGGTSVSVQGRGNNE